MRRALEIGESIYGLSHPTVAVFLSNMAGLLAKTQRLAEAETLAARAYRILSASHGMHHPHSQEAKGNYLMILQEQGICEVEIQLKMNAILCPEKN